MFRFASVLTGWLVLLAIASAAEPKKYALLVGVNKYEHAKLQPLQYAINDATELRDVLKLAGYETLLLTNDTTDKPTRETISNAVADVLRKARAGDTVVFAFAGHGLQFEGDKDSYFCPIDARPFKDETKTLVSMGTVYSEMEKSFAGVKILLVDACRDDPDTGRGSRGIDADSALRPPRGVAAFFSCSASQRAYEHPDLKHGVFFHHVLEGLRGKAKNSEDEVTFNSLVDYVGRNVERDVPKLIGGGAQQQPNQKADLRGRSPVLVAALAANEPKPGEERDFDVGNGVKMRFCWIPGSKGKFTIGSPKTEKERIAGVEDEYEVVGVDGFWMSKYEVTQGQYVKLTGLKNPSYFCSDGGGKDEVAGMSTDDFPVEMVSWEDAQVCIKKMKVPAGMRKIGLPSEVQWEWAARGGKGNSQAFYWGDELNGDKANCNGEYPYGTTTKGPYLGRTTKVGSYESKALHPWGLCDMAGNVWEWCEDYYGPYDKLPAGRNPVQTIKQSGYRVLRGGSWGNDPRLCRCADRNYLVAPDYRVSSGGFRVVVLP